MPRPAIRATLLVARIPAVSVSGFPTIVGSRTERLVLPNTVLAALLAGEVLGTAPWNLPLVSRILNLETAAPAAAMSSRPSWLEAHFFSFFNVDLVVCCPAAGRLASYARYLASSWL